MAGQPETVRTEGVGFKNLGACLQIFLMNGEDRARVGEIQRA